MSTVSSTPPPTTSFIFQWQEKETWVKDFWYLCGKGSFVCIAVCPQLLPSLPLYLVISRGLLTGWNRYRKLVGTKEKLMAKLSGSDLVKMANHGPTPIKSYQISNGEGAGSSLLDIHLLHHVMYQPESCVGWRGPS